jgi:hypothetical protein
MFAAMLLLLLLLLSTTLNLTLASSVIDIILHSLVPFQAQR